MLKLTKKFAATTAFLTVCSMASAIPIVGTLEYNLNDTVFDFNSTSVTFADAPNGKVNNADGDLAGLIDLNIEHWDFVYDPFAAAVTPLMEAGGFSFDLTDVIFAEFTPIGSTSLLTIVGMGVGSLAGFDETDFLWTFTASKSPNASNYSATLESQESPVTVPDGGYTLTLLGLGVAIVLTASRTRANRSSSAA